MRLDNKYTYGAYIEDRRHNPDVDQTKGRAKKRREKWLQRKAGCYNWPENQCKNCCSTNMSYCSGCNMWNCYKCDQYGQCMCS